MSLAFASTSASSRELEHAGDRPEDLLLRDPHLVVDVDEHRRLEVVAARVLLALGLLAAAEHLRAFLLADLDVRCDTRSNCSCDTSGPSCVIGSNGSPMRIALRARDQLLDELVVDLLVHEDARARRADLAAVGEDAEHRVRDRAVDVDVVEDDVRRLAAELERDRLQVGDRVARDLLPGRRLAGEGDLVDVGVRRRAPRPRSGRSPARR